VHTADVHIGDDNDPAWRLAGFEAVIDAVLATAADALLIAGDFFDSARVRETESDAALSQLARLNVPALLTPGNHDCLGPPSIYSRVRLADAGRHVRFLDDPDGGHAVLDDLGLTVWARALVDHHPGHNPLAGYESKTDGNWQVAMAHGHFVPASQPNDRSSPLLEAEIARLGCDYLALGHWHVFQQIAAAGGVPAYYPGSPSESAGSFPSVNLVTLDPETGVSVERIELPKFYARGRA